MIFFDKREVEIKGGNFKAGYAIVRNVRTGAEYGEVDIHDLRAEGGFVEILHAINGANAAKHAVAPISKGEFIMFEKVIKVLNVPFWHATSIVKELEDGAGLNKEKIEIIISSYKNLKKEFGI